MKMRSVEIVSEESITSAGETIVKDFPSDFIVTALAIEQKGQNVTDEATLTEILAGFGEIEVSTLYGTPIKWDADDLYYFNRDVLRKPPYISGITESTDNEYRYASLIVPFNPRGVWDPTMGITPASKGRVKIVAGGDTAAGMDGRSITITALGVEGGNPQSFLGAYLDSFTSIVGDNYRDIQRDRVVGVMGAYLFSTTGPEDLTTSDAPGCKHMGWGVTRSLKNKIGRSALQQLFNNIDVAQRHTHTENTAATYTQNATTASSTAPNSDYVLLDTGLHRGEVGIPYVDDLQIYINAGVAEAMRLYPLLAIRN